MDAPFGRRLAAAYLDVVWPRAADEEPDWMSADDAAKVFFDKARPFRELADLSEHLWAPSAVAEVDDLLWKLALSGEVDFEPHLTGARAVEFWRRWEYAITGLTLEGFAETGYRISVPRGAPAPIRETVVILAMMGGPARDYHLPPREGVLAS